MKRIRKTTDSNNQVTATDTLEVDYIRIQPVVIAVDNNIGSLAHTEWKIIFSPDVDVLASDVIEYNGKEYDISSYYAARDKDDVMHHIEVII